MSDNKPMAGAERVPEVKYSAAYSTGRELMPEPRYGCAEEVSLRRAASPKVSPKGLQRAARERIIFATGYHSCSNGVY